MVPRGARTVCGTDRSVIAGSFRVAADVGSQQVVAVGGERGAGGGQQAAVADQVDGGGDLGRQELVGPGGGDVVTQRGEHRGGRGGRGGVRVAAGPQVQRPARGEDLDGEHVAQARRSPGAA